MQLHQCTKPRWELVAHFMRFLTASVANDHNPSSWRRDAGKLTWHPVFRCWNQVEILLISYKAFFPPLQSWLALIFHQLQRNVLEWFIRKKTQGKNVYHLRQTMNSVQCSCIFNWYRRVVIVAFPAKCTIELFQGLIGVLLDPLHVCLQSEWSLPAGLRVSGCIGKRRPQRAGRHLRVMMRRGCCLFQS